MFPMPFFDTAQLESSGYLLFNKIFYVKFNKVYLDGRNLRFQLLISIRLETIERYRIMH